MKYIIAPIATALFLLSGCDNAQTSAPQQPTPEVGVVTLQSQPVPVVSQLTGRTTASLSAEVRPQQGITRDAKGDATALVVDAANKVEQRTVETGDTYGDKWLVLSGLKAGDKLIVEGTGKVAPGQTVKAVAVNNNGGNA
ncbi:HlyD family secretion protein [Klebsiella pneumoniae]